MARCPPGQLARYSKSGRSRLADSLRHFRAPAFRLKRSYCLRGLPPSLPPLRAVGQVSERGCRLSAVITPFPPRGAARSACFLRTSLPCPKPGCVREAAPRFRGTSWRRDSRSHVRRGGCAELLSLRRWRVLSQGGPWPAFCIYFTHSYRDTCCFPLAFLFFVFVFFYIQGSSAESQLGCFCLHLPSAGMEGVRQHVLLTHPLLIARLSTWLLLFSLSPHLSVRAFIRL